MGAKVTSPVKDLVGIATGAVADVGGSIAKDVVGEVVSTGMEGMINGQKEIMLGLSRELAFVNSSEDGELPVGSIKKKHPRSEPIFEKMNKVAGALGIAQVTDESKFKEAFKIMNNTVKEFTLAADIAISELNDASLEAHGVPIKELKRGSSMVAVDATTGKSILGVIDDAGSSGLDTVLKAISEITPPENFVASNLETKIANTDSEQAILKDALRTLKAACSKDFCSAAPIQGHDSVVTRTQYACEGADFTPAASFSTIGGTGSTMGVRTFGLDEFDTTNIPHALGVEAIPANNLADVPRTTRHLEGDISKGIIHTSSVVTLNCSGAPAGYFMRLFAKRANAAEYIMTGGNIPTVGMTVSYTFNPADWEYIYVVHDEPANLVYQIAISIVTEYEVDYLPPNLVSFLTTNGYENPIIESKFLDGSYNTSRRVHFDNIFGKVLPPNHGTVRSTTIYPLWSRKAAKLTRALELIYNITGIGLYEETYRNPVNWLYAPTAGGPAIPVDIIDARREYSKLVTRINGRFKKK
jgi:hypothetical protein